MLRLLPLLILALSAPPAAGHFREGTQVREIVVEETGEGTRVWVRAPLPLVFADEIAAAARAGRPLASPFLRLERTGAGPRYRLSAAAVAARPEAFAHRLAGALAFSRDGRAQPARLDSFRLSPRRPRGRFDSAAAARAALAEPTTALDPVFGAGVVEYALTLPPGRGALSVASALPAIALPEGVAIDNHLTRQSTRRALTATEPGQLARPAAFPLTAGAAFASFAETGFVHILMGLDHVLLVVCFAIGLGWSRRLFWVVTAFTLGHSATLALGAAGLVPQAPWLRTAVEAAIAASIAAAAVAAWRRDGPVDTRRAAALAAAIGLVHGVGFSSVLSDRLAPGSAAFLPALAGFNVGLELGQIALVAATLAFVSAAGRVAPALGPPARALTLSGIAAASAWWFLERAGLPL